ncbi:MAG: hypothetical protein K2G29_09930 [Muribaculaceae bacterium]|nr:hypothetical protein [Muribaculaceae bacterium]
MNDIILIDDNSKGQRLIYGAPYVDEGKYADVLQHYEKMNKNSDLSFLCDARCVLIHDSLEDWLDGKFDQYSHIAKDCIIEFVEDHDIPYVCFSDGHQSTGKYDEAQKNILQLKKSDFYHRLEYFLERYISESEIQLNILAYGPNYLKDLMTVSIRGLLKKLQTKHPADYLSSSDVMPSTSDEPHFLEEIVVRSQPAIGISYADLLDLIDDENITVRDFRRQLNNILTSIVNNGKNTYSWK